MRRPGLDDDDKVAAKTKSEPSPVPHVLDDATWAAAPSKVRLACVLLAEKHRGSSSYYAGYIDHLPGLAPALGWERSDTLDRWTDAELALLQCPALVERTEARVAADRAWYARLLPGAGPGAGTSGDDGFACTFEEFVWALGIVRTRAFSGKFSASTTSRRDNLVGNDYALLPIIDDLNHRERRRAASASASATTSETTAPVPAAAFPYPAVVDVLGRTSAAVCWVAHVAHKPGQEVAHSYLTGSEGVGESFLHEWGFTPGPDDIDAVAVDVEGVALVLRGDWRLHDEGDAVNRLRRVLGGSGRLAAEGDIWEMVAMACDAAETDLDLDDGGGSSSETGRIAPHRRAIAQSFVDGRRKLLRSGSRACRERAETSII